MSPGQCWIPRVRRPRVRTVAGIVLQCPLQAAALSGDGVQNFRRWFSTPDLAKEALEIPGPPDASLGWQADLMGIIDGDPRTTSNSRIGVSAVAPISSPKVFVADVSPGHGRVGQKQPAAQKPDAGIHLRGNPGAVE